LQLGSRTSPPGPQLLTDERICLPRKRGTVLHPFHVAPTNKGADELNSKLDFETFDMRRMTCHPTQLSGISPPSPDTLPPLPGLWEVCGVPGGHGQRLHSDFPRPLLRHVPEVVLPISCPYNGAPMFSSFLKNPFLIQYMHSITTRSLVYLIFFPSTPE